MFLQAAAIAISLWALPYDLVFAGTRIAVLEFELNDLTLLPRVPEEVKRTASLGPLLRQALAEKDGYQLVLIDPRVQVEANTAFGYLFDHPEVTAVLGSKFGADWVVVGRVHKPSFLFVYLKAHLVDVKAQRLAGDFVVEIKGNLNRLNEEGIASLAEQIDQTIKRTIHCANNLTRYRMGLAWNGETIFSDRLVFELVEGLVENHRRPRTNGDAGGPV